MTEFSLLSDIFGRGAWPMIKEMDGIEVFNVNVNNRSCFMTLRGQEYKITRANQRKWQVTATGYCRVFGSQWELLSWICDWL